MYSPSNFKVDVETDRTRCAGSTAVRVRRIGTARDKEVKKFESRRVGGESGHEERQVVLGIQADSLFFASKCSTYLLLHEAINRSIKNCFALVQGEAPPSLLLYFM